jgi:hypothetical protein
MYRILYTYDTRKCITYTRVCITYCIICVTRGGKQVKQFIFPGIIRSMHCKKEYRIDAIPVDMAINGFILLAYKTALQK